MKTIRTARKLTLAACIALGFGFATAQDMDSADTVPRPSSGKMDKASSIPGLNCNGEVVAPGKITLPIGKSTLIKLPESVTNRTLGNPSVAQAMLVSPETLYLLGIDIGTTNMILQGKTGKCSAIDVTVTMDPAGLQAMLKELMPEETGIRVSAAADSLILSGSVSDSIASSRAHELALAFVRRPARVSKAAQDETMATGGNNTQNASLNQLATNINLQQTRVINLLSVTAAQQVMLEVKIAEISKTLLDKMGASVSGGPMIGSLNYTLDSNFITGLLGGKASILKRSGSGVSIEAEKKDGLVKVLAEPTVMAISGQEGSFLAGGKILIPVAQDSLTNRIVLEEKEFGVGLKFTPTVLAGGRINLRVAPEASELSKDGVGITLNGSSVPQAVFPLITTRRAATTVQLIDGQSFAIGGLIKNNTTANIKAFPILGEIPILGALFRSSDFQSDRTELLFIVTPRLVKPLPVGYKLPTENYQEPSRTDIFINGKLEGGDRDDQNNRPKNDPAGFELK